jgi:hypothetical protein
MSAATPLLLLLAGVPVGSGLQRELERLCTRLPGAPVLLHNCWPCRQGQLHALCSILRSCTANTCQFADDLEFELLHGFGCIVCCMLPGNAASMLEALQHLYVLRSACRCCFALAALILMWICQPSVDEWISAKSAH